MLRINTISRPVFFTRNDKTIETNSSGEFITEAEFVTIISDGEVVCIDETTGQRYTYTPGEPVVYMTQQETVTAPTESQELPATDAGRVPAPVETGSETPKT